MRSIIKMAIVWAALRGFIKESIAMYLITLLNLRGA